MAKAVRWQIPFVSTIENKKYRIDIYDETGGWSGVTTLIAGPTPFVTDEDSSMDLFEPIRIQTGNIQVCTSLPDGGSISLNDLLPETNISRPVRLVNTDGFEIIKWQGFLSCEAYNQNYVDTPQIVELPVISVLEAMDNIEISPYESIGYEDIIVHILFALKNIENKCGMTLFSEIYVPTIMDTSALKANVFDNTYFLSEKVINGDNILVEVHSISCKKILSQFAKFYGLVFREVGQDIFIDMPDSLASETMEVRDFADYYQYRVVEKIGYGGMTVNRTEEDIINLRWRGTGHQLNINQGKRRIKITSELKDFVGSLSLLECPLGSLVENPETRQSTYGEIYCNTNDTFYSLAKHQCLNAIATFASDGTSGATLTFNGLSSSIGYGDTIFWKNNDFRTYYKELVGPPPRTKQGTISLKLTSFMGFWRDQAGNLMSGLILCGCPKWLLYQVNPVSGYSWSKFALTKDNYIFKQSSALPVLVNSGYIRLKLYLAPVVWNGYGFPMWSNDGGVYSPGWYKNYTPSLTIAIQVGDKWVNRSGSTYSIGSSFQAFSLDLNYYGSTKSNWSASIGTSLGISEESGLYIPISSTCRGNIVLYIYHEIDGVVNGTTWTAPFEVIVRSFSLDYLPIVDELESNRSQNNYMIDTGSNFRDELDVDLAIASYAENNKQATLIFGVTGEPQSLVDFGDERKRPEVYLLERMKKLYKNARQTLDLVVERPTNALPLMRFNGIADEKKYNPISESRDWGQDISTIRFQEIPNE